MQLQPTQLNETTLTMKHSDAKITSEILKKFVDGLTPDEKAIIKKHINHLDKAVPNWTF